MQATMTTLAGFPAALSRSANRLMPGLERMAERAAMYSTARRSARPPQIARFPRNFPLSQAWGATPTREAISRRFRVPI